MAEPLKFDAPIFRPTVEQFQDVLGYISSIRVQAEPVGLAKIIPPPEVWHPEFGLDLSESLTFKTRVQRIDELHRKLHTKQESDSWWEKYRVFWMENKGHKKIGNPPSIGRRPVDLFKLFKAVEKRGGHAGCCERQAWEEVSRIVKVTENSLPS